MQYFTSCRNKLIQKKKSVNFGKTPAQECLMGDLISTRTKGWGGRGECEALHAGGCSIALHKENGWGELETNKPTDLNMA